ncbi:hypothetical protein CTI12_AA423330 [Artemisia annua]|uniref:Uncharacterized protein n=1 Tax=Artemisia annua TaxID=35608 RepID=A0A2U1M3L9_ARTAN|nr:hypothetical protein CTI12_AA423330 [Artemisia annua]
MDVQIENQQHPSPVVKVTFCLGSEKHAIEYWEGIISDQLVFVKGESMGILKEYITKHNVPNDVPDDAEILSEDDDGETEKPIVKSKKIRKN